MLSKHIGFFPEQSYGHIVPTLGLALELMRRGHRVSYAVTPSFAALVRRYGAHAMTFQPINTREQLCNYVTTPDGNHDFDFSKPELARMYLELKEKRTVDAVSQLSGQYREDPLDLVVHDDGMDVAGRALAVQWRIPKIRHFTLMISGKDLSHFVDDEIILLSIPSFFNWEPQLVDGRFKFVGFVAEGRKEFSEPWTHVQDRRPTILAAPTTSLMPQISFCELMVRAFEHQPLNVVLTVPGHYDALSAIDPTHMPTLPENFRVNRYSSNLDILERASLFIGQAGGGGIFEAVHCGVPQLLIPVSPVHDEFASRAVQLGLGTKLRITEASPERVREAAVALLEDKSARVRVVKARQLLQKDLGARGAVDLIEDYLSRGKPP